MKIKRFFSVLLAVFLAVGAFALPANAAVKDTSRDVTLTIYALETADGSNVTVDTSVTGEQVTISDKEPIAGVSYLLYKVSDTETSTEIPSDVTPISTEKTGADGSVSVTIAAKEQGRYLVVENECPAYAKGASVPFLVDLPMTNPDGTDYLYDVYVYPKQLVNGAVKLQKTFGGNTPQNGETAVFTLENSDGVKTDYTTSSDGMLVINDLPFGSYKLTESKTADGYVLTNELWSFTIEKGGYALWADGNIEQFGTVVDLGTTDNPKEDTDTDIPLPTIAKKVSDDGAKTFKQLGNVHSIDGEKAIWKISVSVPENVAEFDVYTVTDILDSRLIAPKSDEIKANIGNNSVSANAYKASVKGNKVQVDFSAAKLIEYAGKTLDITFPTAIDLKADNSVGEVIKNIASLTFTDVKGTNPGDDTTTISTPPAGVWTGAITGFKHDNDNNPLSGAEFTLYYDKDCKKSVAKTTSGDNGKFAFKGLAEATYYLKETKAPSGYQADTRVLEVKISEESAVVEIDALNIPKANLPLTGGAGTLGLTVFGAAVVAFGVFMIIKGIKTFLAYRKSQPSMT